MKEIKEKKNRMGKARDLFKKIGNIKGTFQSNMSTIKDRNSKDLIEQKRSRRNGNNALKNYAKMILMTQITKMLQSLTQRQTFWSVKSSGT